MAVLTEVSLTLTQADTSLHCQTKKVNVPHLIPAKQTAYYTGLS